jgi:hypothetical protein
MEHSMKMLLATIALESVLAAPTLAQGHNTRTLKRRARTGRPECTSTHRTVWHGNQNANSDFQLSYSRWALSTEDHFTRIGGA